MNSVIIGGIERVISRVDDYVELGDKDSAKAILDEVMADGNDEQRKQAEDLLGQI